MKVGKVSDTILSRAVLKPVNTVRTTQVERLDIGQDAGGIKLEDMELLTASACGYMPLIKAVNNIYAAGGVPLGVSDCIVMNEEAREIRLREVIAGLTRQVAVTGVPVTGGHTTVSGSVSAPVVTVTAAGVRKQKRAAIAPGQSIIMTGYIGLSGVRQLIDRYSDRAGEVYSRDYIAEAYGSDEELYIGNIVNILRENNISCYMHDVSEGGILGALWDMCEYGHTGLEVDIRSIQVKQEIIEICELFNINPYELESMGCLLMTSQQDCDIIDVLNNHNIEACVIGRITKGNQKILRNRDEERFLELPKQDALYGIDE